MTTTRRRRLLLAFVVVVSVAAAACGSDPAQPVGSGTKEQGKPLAPAPETIEHAGDWPAPGRDLAGTRAATDSPIDSGSIDRLQLAWKVPIPGPGVYGNASSTPVVVGDTVVVQDLTSTVRAIDLVTGKVRWARTYDQLSIGPNGPAVGYGRVFVAKGMKEIAALDLETGQEVWSRRITRTDTDGIDIQPQVFGEMVFASTVPISLDGQYTGGDRGVLHALDVHDGSVRWTFDTVKGEDLWGNPKVNSGGGAWFTPSIDVDSGTIYWGIANPAPFPGVEGYPNGSSRPGPNLYTDSVVALDASTGKLRWYHQAVPHDLLDRDLIHTMVVPVGASGGRKVVVGTGKLGRVIGLDPESGKLLWDTEVGDHENDDRTELDGPTTVLPGTFGGVLTPPAAADGVVYVAVINAPSTLTPDQPSYIGSQLGLRPGALVAVDATDGDVLWSTPIDGDPLGGATVVGNLVLTATSDGMLLAFDRTTGKQVWSQQAAGGLNGWPAVVGDTILWPVGSADPPALVAYRLTG